MDKHFNMCVSVFQCHRKRLDIKQFQNKFIDTQCCFASLSLWKQLCCIYPQVSIRLKTVSVEVLRVTDLF